MASAELTTPLELAALNAALGPLDAALDPLDPALLVLGTELVLDLLLLVDEKLLRGPQRVRCDVPRQPLRAELGRNPLAAGRIVNEGDDATEAEKYCNSSERPRDGGEHEG